MHVTPRLLYGNAAFDLAMNGPVPADLRPLLAEMTVWMMPMGEPGDAIVLDTRVPASYLDYLASVGLSAPTPLEPRGVVDGAEGMPWGWDSDALARLAAHGAAVHHPPLDCVQRANARSYSHALAATLGYTLAGSRLCWNLTDVTSAMDTARSWPQVVKPQHGNAGVGFGFLSSPDFRAAGLAHAQRLFEHGNTCVVLEPWLQRTLDISTLFELTPDGAVVARRHSRMLVTPSGAARGIVVGQADDRLAPFADRLDRMVDEVAGSLHDLGYCGPVNVDSMAALVGGEERLFPLLEINARQSLGFICDSVARRLACERWRLLRTVGRSRLSLPSTYDELHERLGPLEYNRERRCGVVVLTPLRLGEPGAERAPYRSTFYLAASTRAELQELDVALTRIVKRVRAATGPESADDQC